MSEKFSDIRVFHFSDSRSNKLWVIGLNSQQNPVTWWGPVRGSVANGRLGNNLHSGGDVIGKGYSQSINEKLRKGYRELKDKTFLPESRQVVPRGSLEEHAGCDPSYFYVMEAVPESALARIDAMAEALFSTCGSICAENFSNLAVVRALRRGQSTGAVPYTEDVLGVLALLALRLEYPMSLVDDRGIEISSVFKEWQEKPTFDRYETTVLRTFAECVGAIKKRVDLTQINTDVSAAFF